MKASVYLLTGCVALGLALPAIQSQAATPPAVGVATALSATGQLLGGSESRRQADDLLRRARQAMKEGNFDQAESLIIQADKLGVKYNPLTDRFVDTPESLRKVLNEEKAKAGSGPQKPSSAFPALLQREQQQPQPIPNDPFASQKRSDAVDRLTDDSKAKAVSYVQEARAALQRGDRTGAIAAYQKAIGVPAPFGPQEDSPQRLAADLSAMGVNVAQLAPASGTPTSPFALKPSDIDASGDRLPLLPSNGPPVQQNNQPSPYNLQPGSNPLDAGAQNGGYQAPAMLAQNVSAPPANMPQGYVPPGSAPQGGNYQISDFAMPAAPPAGMQGASSPTKAEAQRLIAQARMALDKGDLNSASRLADQAQHLNVPEDAYGPEETRPWQIHLEISKSRSRNQGIMQAAGTSNIPGQPQYPVTQGAYNPANDTTRMQPASSESPLLRQESPAASSEAQRLYDEGLRALDAQDRDLALQKFSEAWKRENELDPETRSQLKDKLTFLRNVPPPAAGLPANPGASPIDQVNSDQEVNRQRLMREIANEQKAAEQLAQKDPRGALNNLKKVRERVVSAEVSQGARKQLLTLVDKSIAELDLYIERNQGEIENAERNEEIRSEVVRNEELTVQTQDKLANMVEEFNKLMDERRFAEAEVIAKQAREMMPNDPVVVLMMEKSRFARNIAENQSIKEAKENGVIGAMLSVERSATPFDDSNPIVFGDVRQWDELTKSRRRLLMERNNMSPAEMEIQRSLSKPVEVRFDSRPLQEVMDALGSMAGVNVHLDPNGLHAEGVGSDTPVTINLTQPISLKSALNLVLEPLGLSYVIQNEVLKITSEQTRDSNVYAKVYYVADLVIPIPNFAPSYNLGLPGALRESLNSLGYGSPMRPSMSGPLTVANSDPNANQQVNPLTMQPVMAQAPMMNSPVMSGQGGRGAQTLGSGPGGLGGGVQADFDPLIELITTTISPQSWDEVGGPGSVSGFDTNLSLVVSQTQDVHEKIADLLEQLRRLQDLQVTIEVRFITLSDRFFERIGVDFDFDVDDNTGLNNRSDLLPGGPGEGNPEGWYDDRGPSRTYGLTNQGGTGIPTADLDFSLSQGSFGLTTPVFGGFDQAAGASFGFAILSDIEAFFLVNAAQGDDRTNVLQAPKVTLFNGQQAFVSDTSQRPFVTSVIPVVGDFAAAHQPVIVVLSEGTSLSVQAVVSSDRRFVRLTMVPFFSRIGDVETFTFTGKTTTDTGTTVQDPSDPDKNVTNNTTRTTEGTTVQLPTFAFTTVVTTVSVPDGGTVLLGGIKRLREGRNERGTPLLSKIPYVSRLFKNVGIGRDAQSLMMMVTPRIIIQEEEEEKLGIQVEE